MIDQVSTVEYWDIGDAPTIWAEFRNPAGVLTDATVTLRVRKPDGTIVTPAPTRASLGRYEASVPIDQHGVWHYRFTAAGTLVAVEAGRLYVRRDKVG